MSEERLSMRRIREILRLHFEKQLPRRAIARSVGISASTVSHYVYRASQAKLSWPLPAELDSDAALLGLLFKKAGERPTAPAPDWAWVHRELKRKHVTKRLLWEEYKTANPGGYQYSQFCFQYQRWEKKTGLSMRQNHRLGEKMFVDFSGDGVNVVDGVTGEVRVARLFVAVLGASNYTWVEPVFSENLATWTSCHVNACEAFGGVSEVWVPDNPKAGTTKADKFEPQLNPTYVELATHYGAAVVPARPRKPKDKAKVENAVLVAERWILASLRNRVFHSLNEVREAIAPLRDKLNDKTMRRVGKSRRQLFLEMEKPALRPLPTKRYEFSRWGKAKIGVDYHFEYEGHFYSAPHAFVGETVEVRATANTIEALLGGLRISTHIRSEKRGGHTTQTEHMPRGHREYAEWTPERLVSWAEKYGPNTAALVTEIMKRKPHPQQGFRACLGVMSLSRKYDVVRIEAACARAVQASAFSYKSVKAILQNNLDRETLSLSSEVPLPPHDNIRGPEYFH